jgi:hypothetical protein
MHLAPFADWGNFYVIVGSSAGALIGLQFVVMTLIAGSPSLATPEAGAAFATPTIIHFGVVVLLSAAGSMPWHGIGGLATVWGLIAFAGIVYGVLTARRMRSQSTYRPVLEDWIFHCHLPFAAYVLLAIAAGTAGSHPRGAAFGVAAATLALLSTGVHNAWDAVTWHVLHRRPGR